MAYRTGDGWPWLAANVPFSEDTAERYRATCQAASTDPKIRTMRNLTDIYRFLADPEQGVAGRWRNGKGNTEWYSPPDVIEAARKALGGIDVDPASCALAQQAVLATTFFSTDDDGLKREWHGTVWLNPPFNMMPEFVDHLLAELDSGRCKSAILLGPASCDVPWFHEAAAAARAWCFPAKRFPFTDPNGHIQKSLWPSVLFYFGQSPQHFAKAFRPIGFVRLL